MREESIERYLRLRTKDAGGLCIKLNPAGFIGIPDRLVVLSGGWIAFVEVKKPRGGLVGKLQFWWRERLVELNVKHRFVFTHDDVDGLLDDWRADQ